VNTKFIYREKHSERMKSPYLNSGGSGGVDPEILCMLDPSTNHQN